MKTQEKTGEKQIRTERLCKVGKQGKKRRGLWLAAALAVIALLLAGTALARYVRDNKKRAEMISSQFHISSDYLEETVKQYTVMQGDEIVIRLFNYEKENTAQRAAEDIQYKITAQGAAGVTVSVKDENGAVVGQDAAGNYTLPKSGENTWHELRIPTQNLTEGAVIAVNVTTTAPYQKELKADFAVWGSTQPEYTIKDQNDGTVLVTVKSNAYSGPITVSWDENKFSPDNTNKRMTDWEDSASSGTFQAEKNAAYELLFFKKTEKVQTDSSGKGAAIQLR